MTRLAPLVKLLVGGEHRDEWLDALRLDDGGAVLGERRQVPERTRRVLLRFGRALLYESDERRDAIGLGDERLGRRIVGSKAEHRARRLCLHSLGHFRLLGTGSDDGILRLPCDERRDAAQLRKGHLVRRRVAQKARTCAQNTLGAIGRADGRGAEQTHEPLGDHTAVLGVLGGERSECAGHALHRALRPASHKQREERVDAAKLGNRVLVTLVIRR